MGTFWDFGSYERNCLQVMQFYYYPCKKGCTYFVLQNTEELGF